MINREILQVKSIEVAVVLNYHGSDHLHQQVHQKTDQKKHIAGTKHPSK